MWIDLFVVLIAAFAATWLGTKATIVLMHKWGVMDAPNYRSSHSRPVPRGGGVAIFIGLAAGLTAAYTLGMPPVHLSLLLAVSGIFVLGFLDDFFHGLPAGVRMLVQILLAGLFISQAGSLERLPFPAPLDFELGWTGAPISIIWLVGVANIYNFLDGIDGYASVQGIVAAAGLAFLIGGQTIGFSTALIGALCGFLWFNWHPAKIFMGDSGSYMLGFSFAAIPFLSDEASTGVFAAALLLWFFLADGAFTMFRRLLKGEKIWRAHRSHLYQRLVKSGLSHSKVVLLAGAMMLLLAAYACWVVRRTGLEDGWQLLAAAAALFLIYWMITLRAEKTSAQG